MNDSIFTTVQRFTDMRILVIGEAMLDVYLKGRAERLCQEAPVPIVDISEELVAAGGAANTAINVAQLGAKAIFVSVVGADREAQRLTGVLKQNGIETRLFTDTSRTTMAKRRVMAGDQLVVRYDSGSKEAISGQAEDYLLAQLAELYERVDAVIVSDYGYGILTPRVIGKLRQLQAGREQVLSVDAKQLERYAALNVTAVKPNWESTRQLLGIHSSVASSQRLALVQEAERTLFAVTGAKVVAATLDRDGAVVLHKGEAPYRTYTKPSDNSKAAGAGDTYISALTLALATGSSVPVAAELAAAAAAVTVHKHGTASCSRAELQAYFTAGNKFVSDKRDLKKRLAQLRAQGKRIVFTNGCFDILHSGHVSYLNVAKSLGDVLIIGVNSDVSVKRLKGPSRPVNTLADRARVLAALSAVDMVVGFKEDTPVNLIELVRPDVHVKGGDYQPDDLPEKAVVEKYGGRVEIVPFLYDVSTTAVIRRINAGSPKKEAHA